MIKEHYKADLWLLLATFFWGVTFVTVKDAMGYASPLAFLGARFLLAGVLLLPFCWRAFARLGRRGWRDGVILGAFLFGGFAFQTAGLVHTTATRSAFITGLAVVLVPVFSIAMLKKPVDRWLVLGALLASGGLYFLSRPAGGGFNRGDLLTALCAVCFAVEIILVEIYTKRHRPMDLVMAQIVTTVGLCGALAWAVETPRLQLTPGLWLDLFVTSVLATVGALAIQFTWQRRTDAARAAVIYTMEPLFAALFAFLVAGERMNGAGWLGAGLILVGMLASELSKQ
ncbi:MAG: DMT family transporter [Candidatus Edwardsbacteria bacterium]|jgi:drug/metabolite transporter (DMT)-like permease|nr:DMT family transporter [Candidatus Edwardsbacteria bacterium]